MQFAAALASWQMSRIASGPVSTGLNTISHRHAGRCASPCDDRLRIGGDLLEHFIAVQVLTAGDEPDFEWFEVDHGNSDVQLRIA